MGKKITYVCDKCGDKSTDIGYVEGYWAFISFRSHAYMGDTGDVRQDYDWCYCRSCKVEFLTDMDKQTRKKKKKK